MRSLVLAGLMLGVGIVGAVDDPPRKLTSEERKELGARAVERNEAGIKAHRAQRLDEAERAFRDALPMWRRLHEGRDHSNVANSLSNLAGLLRDRSRSAEAEPLFREALAMRRRLYPGRDHPDLALSLNNLAEVLDDLGGAGE